MFSMKGVNDIRAQDVLDGIEQITQWLGRADTLLRTVNTELDAFGKNGVKTTLENVKNVCGADLVARIASNNL